MKKVLFAALMLVSGYAVAFAQATKKEDVKEYNRAVTMVDQTTLKKIEKEAKAEAKSLKKEGWKPATGSLPLEEQLYAVFTKQKEADIAEELGKLPKFIFGENMARGSNYSAARKQAMELARVDLAGKIESKVAEIVTNSVQTADLSAEETTSLSKTVSESKTLVKQNLGRVTVAYEAYREVDGKYQVSIRLQYSTKNLMSTYASILANESEKTREAVSKALATDEEE